MESCIHISLHWCEWDTVNMAKAIQTRVSKYQSIMRNTQEDEKPISHNGRSLELCSVKAFMCLTSIRRCSIRILGGKSKIPAEAYRRSSQYLLKITQQPLNFTSLFIHHHTILQHVTKWSLNINNMIRSCIIFCYL